MRSLRSCATCHGSNGSGHTTIGRNVYPKAPDMRLPATQNLTDGELYFTIANGIRLALLFWGAQAAFGKSYTLEEILTTGVDNSK